MKKIVSLFRRDYKGTHLVYDEIVEGAEWVIAGEGVATEKFDGTACLVKDDILYKRYDCKHGRKPPLGFVPAQDADPETRHWPGWVPVTTLAPEDKWHRQAWDLLADHQKAFPPEGTYELVGPKVQGNPYGIMLHMLWKHGKRIVDAPRVFGELQCWFRLNPHIEGVVWHHPDGRMVKIKRRDFGLSWPDRGEKGEER